MMDRIMWWHEFRAIGTPKPLSVETWLSGGTPRAIDSYAVNLHLTLRMPLGQVDRRATLEMDIPTAVSTGVGLLAMAVSKIADDAAAAAGEKYRLGFEHPSNARHRAIQEDINAVLKKWGYEYK